MPPPAPRTWIHETPDSATTANVTAEDYFESKYGSSINNAKTDDSDGTANPEVAAATMAPAPPSSQPEAPTLAVAAVVARPRRPPVEVDNEAHEVSVLLSNSSLAVDTPEKKRNMRLSESLFTSTLSPVKKADNNTAAALDFSDCDSEISSTESNSSNIPTMMGGAAIMAIDESVEQTITDIEITTSIGEVGVAEITFDHDDDDDDDDDEDSSENRLNTSSFSMIATEDGNEISFTEEPSPSTNVATAAPAAVTKKVVAAKEEEEEEDSSWKDTSDPKTTKTNDTLAAVTAVAKKKKKGIGSQKRKKSWFGDSWSKKSKSSSIQQAGLIKEGKQWPLVSVEQSQDDSNPGFEITTTTTTTTTKAPLSVDDDDDNNKIEIETKLPPLFFSKKLDDDGGSSNSNKAKQQGRMMKARTYYKQERLMMLPSPPPADDTEMELSMEVDGAVTVATATTIHSITTTKTEEVISGGGSGI